MTFDQYSVVHLDACLLVNLVSASQSQSLDQVLMCWLSPTVLSSIFIGRSTSSRRSILISPLRPLLNFKGNMTLIIHSHCCFLRVNYLICRRTMCCLPKPKESEINALGFWIEFQLAKHSTHRNVSIKREVFFPAAFNPVCLESIQAVQ